MVLRKNEDVETMKKLRASNRLKDFVEKSTSFNESEIEAFAIRLGKRITNRK